jgi:cytidylate kinase
MGILTISASYGAGGSEIAPIMAKELGLPFVDRAVPASVARELGVPVEQVEAVEQEVPSRFWSMVAKMGAPDYLSAGQYGSLPSERSLVEQTERELCRHADAGGGVFLGRAAAIVLAGRSDALHVRLDGPAEGRIQAAMKQHGIDHGTAAAACKSNDAARSGYVKHFYRRDSACPDLYHLVIDTVALGWPATEQLILTAAHARGLALV